MHTNLIDILPLLSVILTALLGVGTYAYQEWIKRSNALAEHRRVLYEKWVRNLIELLAAETKVQRSQLISEVEKGWLFASDKVLKATYEYLDIYNELCCSHTEEGTLKYWNVLTTLRRDRSVRKRIGESLAMIFLAMRRDIKANTKIHSQWAKEHLKIYDWGIISEEIESDNG